MWPFPPLPSVMLSCGEVLHQLPWQLLFTGAAETTIGRIINTGFWIVHDDVIKWKHFPCYWHFVKGIHRSPVNSPHKGQWRGVLMFSLICVWINGWVNNRETGDLRCHHAHYDITVMCLLVSKHVGCLDQKDLGIITIVSSNRDLTQVKYTGNGLKTLFHLPS